jgi:segregation and condensation protein A
LVRASGHSGNGLLSDTAAPAGVSAYSVSIDVFEGPLDLLLHLVRKHELDILDIPISFVTEKYIEYLDLLRSLSLDVAGEYLLMAATLAYIKSRELLPSPEPDPDAANEDGEEEADPRQELIRRLLEYQKYKEAGEKLGDRPVVGRNIWTRGAEQRETIPPDVDPDAMAPLKEIPVLKLLEALERALSRAKIRMARHEVSIDRMTVRDRINDLVARLEAAEELRFFSCFRFLQEEVTAEEARHEAVVTLLAILEMAKLGLLMVYQGTAAEGGGGGEAEGEGDGDADEEIIIRRIGTDLASELAAATSGAAVPGQSPAASIDDDYR